MSFPPLHITFLGTGTSSGVPMIGCDCAVCSSSDAADKRLRSSILVQSETTTVVVDTTPDFRYQMLREGLRCLDAVLYTHAHKDHIAGLDDIRPFNFFSGRPLDIYANKMTVRALHHDFAYAFAEHRYPGVPDLRMHELDSAPFCIGDIDIEPVEVWHHKMPVWGYRMGDFTYITDANYISPGEKAKIKGSRVLVLNALRLEKHISHFTLDEAVALAVELAAEQTYFTHMSHQIGLHQEVNKFLPSNIQLAYDGMKIHIY